MNKSRKCPINVLPRLVGEDWIYFDILKPSVVHPKMLLILVLQFCEVLVPIPSDSSKTPSFCSPSYSRTIVRVLNTESFGFFKASRLQKGRPWSLG